ncbi:MAG: chorismate pyruvate-lyase family protein [Bacillota bacterium]|nr:chorismate pyruvate-lyase family protein [Bacillota bacterium]
MTLAYNVECYSKAILNAPIGEIEAAAKLILETINNGDCIAVCGNGGSGSNANLFSALFSKYVTNNNKGLSIKSLNSCTSLITYYAESESYDKVFSSQLQGMEGTSKLLILISGSGNSPNILEAVAAARKLGMKTVGLTGMNGGKLATLVDIPIIVKSNNMEEIENIHTAIIYGISLWVRENNVKYSALMLLNKLVLNGIELSMFQKVLLITDGTVTDLIKLYSGENIKIKIINQELTQSGEEEAFLCFNKTYVLKRKVLLCGEKTNYVYAESIILMDNHSKSAQYKLLETNQPIGIIWKEEHVETYREIIDYKPESCGPLAEYFDVQPETQLISRTYLIYSNQNILGMVTEKFPITRFKE